MSRAVFAVCRIGFILAVALLSVARPAWAQVDLANRPVADVRVEGLVRVPLQLVLNQVRVKKGDPYDPQVVEQDIVRITHLGRFQSVLAQVRQQDDGSLILTYVLQEQPLVSDVQVVGNKVISDQELLAEIQLRAGDPVDSFLLDRSIKRIVRRYEKEGYFSAAVSIDQELLAESGILLFTVREGPQVRIRGFTFEGNQAYTASQLRSKIRSQTYILLLRKGELSRQRLEEDAAQVRDFYRERGYLDARVGRRIDLSPDQRDASVTFLVEEGPRYLVDKIDIEGNELFSDDDLRQTLFLFVGDVYSEDRQRKSLEALQDRYGGLGYLETRVQINHVFHEDAPRVDVWIKIEEGRPSQVGTVTVQGNSLTKDKVVYQQIRGLTPGRRFDRAGIKATEQRLTESAIFSEGKVTVLGNPEDEYRDVLVEVKETNTGSLSFGAGISSDAGVAGAIDLVQRNFDIADWPENLGEFFTGRAFRGAGQYFALRLQPGNESSQYSINFREPYLLDSNYFLDTTAFLYQRVREDYDEERIGGALGLGQRFGDVWSAAIRTRYERVNIDDIDEAAPVDVFDVEGRSTLTSLGLSVSRSTVDSRIFPTQGSRASVALSRYGALGGDYEFTRLDADFNKYWAVAEDFFGRRTVLRLRTEIGYIFEEGEAPIFERFYAGGHRSFRGFEYRGVGPRGIQANNGQEGNDPVGADWMFLLGLEYNFPIYQEIVRGVLFVDSGTVTPDPGFEQYRVSIGAGIRLRIPFLGQAPFAFDFAVPLVKEPSDEEQLFSFDIAVPF